MATGKPSGTGKPPGIGRPAGTGKIQLTTSPKPGNLSNAGKGMTPNFIPPQPNLQLSKGSLNYQKFEFANSSRVPPKGSPRPNGVTKSIPMKTGAPFGGRMTTPGGSLGSKGPLANAKTTVRSLLSSPRPAGGQSPPSNSSLKLATSPKPPANSKSSTSLAPGASNGTAAKADLKRPRRSVDDIEIIGLIGVFRKVGFYAFSMMHQLNMFF